MFAEFNDYPTKSIIGTSLRYNHSPRRLFTNNFCCVLFFLNFIYHLFYFQFPQLYASPFSSCFYICPRISDNLNNRRYLFFILGYIIPIHHHQLLKIACISIEINESIYFTCPCHLPSLTYSESSLEIVCPGRLGKTIVETRNI